MDLSGEVFLLITREVGCAYFNLLDPKPLLGESAIVLAYVRLFSTTEAFTDLIFSVSVFFG
jgi:hypothetical protein